MHDGTPNRVVVGDSYWGGALYVSENESLTLTNMGRCATYIEASRMSFGQLRTYNDEKNKFISKQVLRRATKKSAVCLHDAMVLVVFPLCMR